MAKLYYKDHLITNNLKYGGTAGLVDGTKFAYFAGSEFPESYIEYAKTQNDWTNMFTSASGITSLDFGDWDASNITSFKAAFQTCKTIVNINTSNWKLGNVTNMATMFSNCSKLATLDVSNWDVSKVTAIDNMFVACSALTSMDFSSWNTSSVTKMNNMFGNCVNLITVNMSGWDMSNVTSYDGIFRYSGSLQHLYLDGVITPQETNDGFSIFNGFTGESLNVYMRNTSDTSIAWIRNNIQVAGLTDKITIITD